MKSLIWAAAAAGVLGGWVNVAAAQKATPSQEKPAVRRQAYLGVGIVPLHSSLVNRIASLVGGEYGVLVQEVATDSPAAAAGLKPDDVIYKYDDQRIFNADQLVRLVGGDKPGREVTLGVIRDGKPETVNVILGEREVLVSEQRHRALKPAVTNGGAEKSKEAQDAEWIAFDALTLTRIDATHFKAEIKYRDTKGKIVTRTFQGTRDEITKAIASQKDVPDVERNHLLRALDMPPIDAVVFEIPE